MAKGNGKNTWQIAYAKEIAKLQKERDYYLKRLKEVCNDVSSYVVPEVYSCMVKALAEDYGWNADMIVELVGKMTVLWNNYCANDEIERMVDWAEEYLGVSLHCTDGDTESESGDTEDEA